MIFGILEEDESVEQDPIEAMFKRLKNNIVGECEESIYLVENTYKKYRLTYLATVWLNRVVLRINAGDNAWRTIYSDYYRPGSRHSTSDTGVIAHDPRLLDLKLRYIVAALILDKIPLDIAQMHKELGISAHDAANERLFYLLCGDGIENDTRWLVGTYGYRSIHRKMLAIAFDKVMDDPCVFDNTSFYSGEYEYALKSILGVYNQCNNPYVGFIKLVEDSQAKMLESNSNGFLPTALSLLTNFKVSLTKWFKVNDQ